jgi:DNA-binding response OmpR family regulator
MSVNPYSVQGGERESGGNHVVLMVDDHQEARSDLKQVLELSGYNVIDTDNGQEASWFASQTQPDLLLVDLDVPLLYGLVAARQIVRHAQLGPMPVVILTHEEVLDPASIREIGARGNEYVTRLSDYEELQQLLDYLLPSHSVVNKPLKKTTPDVSQQAEHTHS